MKLIIFPGFIETDLWISSFTPEFVPGIEWIQVANRNWKGIDRGADNDQYFSDITITRDYTTASTFGAYTYIDRILFNVTMAISNFSNSEKVFGPNIDYSGGLNVDVVEVGDWVKKNISTYEATFKLKLHGSPSFVAGASLPTIYIESHSLEAQRTLNVLDSYHNQVYYLDELSDAYFQTINCVMSTSDLSNFLNYWQTKRASAFTLPEISGVRYPFGPNSTAVWPVDVKIIDFSFSVRDINYWDVTIVLVQEFS